jgi:hypothetical protein
VTFSNASNVENDLDEADGNRHRESRASRGDGITFNEAALRLGVSIATVRRLACLSKLYAWRVPTGAGRGVPRVSRESVEDYKLRHRIRPPEVKRSGLDIAPQGQSRIQRPEYKLAIQRLSALGIRSGGEHR